MRPLLFAALLLSGCLEAIAPEVGPLMLPEEDLCNADSDATTAVSFSARIVPILNDQCERCHRPGSEGFRDSGLAVTSYDALLAGGTRSVGTSIVPGKPCASVVYQKLGQAPPFGARMPRNDTPLSTAEQLLFHDWIAEGALDQ